MPQVRQDCSVCAQPPKEIACSDFDWGQRVELDAANRPDQAPSQRTWALMSPFWPDTELHPRTEIRWKAANALKLTVQAVDLDARSSATKPISTKAPIRWMLVDSTTYLPLLMRPEFATQRYVSGRF